MEIQTRSESSVELPADLAIIGVDNIPLSGLVTPPLTTIDLHNDASARATARGPRTGERFNRLVCQPTLPYSA